MDVKRYATVVMRSLFYLIRKCKTTWCETTAKRAESAGSEQTGNASCFALKVFRSCQLLLLSCRIVR